MSQIETNAALTAQLEAAATWCAAQGERLTDTRRDVLALLLTARADGESSGQGGAMKAYDILAALQRAKPTAAPPTVYRALECLQACGLVHRLDSLNAFVACPVYDAHAHDHGEVLLVCGACHHVLELAAPPGLDGLYQLMRTAGFQMAGHELEIKGLCQTCRDISGATP